MQVQCNCAFLGMCIQRYHLSLFLHGFLGIIQVALTIPNVSALNIYETCVYWGVQTIVVVNRFIQCIH